MRKIYLLSISLLSVFTIQAQDCSNIFFSEYVEGSSQNKALEIYNPTNDTIDLSDYVIKRYKNGNGFPDTELNLSGLLAPFDVVVISNGQTDESYETGFVSTELFNLADINGTGVYETSPMFFNGNDALSLEKNDGFTVLDLFGVVGQDPGDGGGWSDVAPSYISGPSFWEAWTKDHAMIRKATVKKGVTQNPEYFNTSLEYDSLPKDTYTNLGFHSCECATVGLNENKTSQVYIYPNPSNLGDFRINSSDEITLVEIYNIIGQPMFIAIKEKWGKSISINSESYKAGIYFIKLNFENSKEQIHKIIIQ